jgi:SWI/SNF-related matrix-associated actin-dependent regulator 1 of chromatin subfamily A
VCEAFKGNVVKVTGDLSTKQKQESVDRFQNGEVQVIVCNIKAGGAGITLTKSSNTIVNDFDWVFANHDQAESRNHRIGQDQSVNIQYLYSLAPIDARMAEILEEKLLNSSLIVDGTEESFAREVLNSVFK